MTRIGELSNLTAMIPSLRIVTSRTRILSILVRGILIETEALLVLECCTSTSSHRRHLQSLWLVATLTNLTIDLIRMVPESDVLITR